jgi:NAD(P) transhydrogenase subunit alpha
MIIGVPAETYPGECRVALTPEAAGALSRNGQADILVQAGAGVAAGFPDAAYAEREVEIVQDRAGVFERADVLLQVRTHGANRDNDADLALLRPGQIVIGLCDALDGTEALECLAQSGATLFAMELMPRITRAQSMDVLSSMATIAGYKAVLLAATHLPRMFPLLMTAAGTLTPARVLVIGAGVAGLQAIATAKRLGAVVLSYDIRPTVKEQVESLGAQFVDLGVEAADAEDAGGYATAQKEDFYRRQQAALAEVVAECHVIVTTAAIPGKKAPILLTEQMVKGMAPGSMVIDLAAERGGNCECTTPGETVSVAGVSVMGLLDVPSSVPFHASQMYSHNISAFLKHLVRDGELTLDAGEDEIVRETLVARDGRIVHPKVLEARALG